MIFERNSTILGMVTRDKRGTMMMVTCCVVVSLLLQHHLLWLVHGFVTVGNYPSQVFAHRHHHHCHQSLLQINQVVDNFASDTTESDDDFEGDDEEVDTEDLYNDDDDDDDLLLSGDDALSFDETQMNFDANVDDNDDDDDESEEDYNGDVVEALSNGMGHELDAPVDIVATQYKQTYQNVKSEIEGSSSVLKTAIISGWFTVMKEWNCDQYNQLLREISQMGAVRDAESILYQMIQQQQQSNDDQVAELLVSDETFYHVYASYQHRHKQQKKNKNKKNRGVGFKVEQLLAIQDALSNNNDELATTPSSHGRSDITIQPSLQTLNAVLAAMTLDRMDPRIALRAHRIWDRIRRQMSDKSPPTNIDRDAHDDVPLTNAAMSTLICCTRVPRMTATPADKLSSFTVALECFNWATTNTDLTERVSPLLAPLPHQSSFYMYFLRSCRVLLSETNESKRDAVVEAAFRRACANGHVDTKVVQAMEEIASDALMLRLLGGFIEDGQSLPAEWSRNCISQNSKSEEESPQFQDR